MYGWLALDPRHGKRAYAAAECGLCARFGQAFRTRTRILAAADPTLLVLALEGLAGEGAEVPETTRVRCPLTFKLTKRRALDPGWEPLAAVAELQLVLAGEKLFDDRLDRDGWAPRVASALLERDIGAAAAALLGRGFPLEALRSILRRQGELERDQRAGLDALAAPTGEALGLIAGWLGERVAQGCGAAMGRFGETLGRLLYLVDALHDLARDRVKGRFNPIDHALGYLSPRRLAWLQDHVEGLARAHAEAFRELPLVRHVEVLEASLVEGLVVKARDGLERVEGMV